MNRLGQFFVVGVVIVLGIKFFGLQQKITDRIVAGVKTKDPEQLVVAAAITTALGMVTVIAAQAFRKV